MPIAKAATEPGLPKYLVVYRRIRSAIDAGRASYTARVGRCWSRRWKKWAAGY